MSKRYIDEYKNTIVELYNSGKTLVELNSEYSLPKSTILTWVKKAKPVAIDNDKVVTQADYQALLNKIARIEEENEILKSNGHICKEVSSVYKFITDNKDKYSIKIMCEVLKVSRNSYYKHLNKKLHYYLINLKLCFSNCSWERYNISDVFHTSHIHNCPFKSKTKTCMLSSTIFSQF